MICEVKGYVICEVKGDQLVTQAINQAITIDLYTIWAILSKRDTTRTLALPEFQWRRDNTEIEDMIFNYLEEQNGDNEIY